MATSEPPNDQRRLNLPALQPVNLGDALTQQNTGSPRFYIQSIPSPSPSAKVLGKRPSTANLAHTAGPLLPASRSLARTVSSESLREPRGEEAARREAGSSSPGPSASSWLHINGEVAGEASNSRISADIFNAEPPGASPPSQQEHHEPCEDDYLDWAAFIQAYAAGNWDPRHTPNPPRCDEPRATISRAATLWDISLRPPVFLPSLQSRPSDIAIRRRVPGTSSISSISSQLLLSVSGGASDRSAGSASTAASSVTSAHSVSHSVPPSVVRPSSVPLKVRREKIRSSADPASTAGSSPFSPNLTMPLPPMRGVLGRSLSDSSSVMSPAQVEEHSRSPSQEIHDSQAAAATVRLAGDGIDVRPLALPSPEMELTDPLRGHTAPLPAPWTQADPQWDRNSQNSDVEHRGSQRKQRLNSFWEGLGEIAESTDLATSFYNADPEPPVGSGHKGSSQNSRPNVFASPMGTPASDAQSPNMPVLPPTNAGGLRLSLALPETLSAPQRDDYFGHSVIRAPGSSPSLISKIAAKKFSIAANQPSENFTDDASSPVNEFSPVFDIGPPSSPSPTDSPRPLAFQRTVSEPIVHMSPEILFPDTALEHDNRPKSEILRARRVREEFEYSMRHYLIPPLPPNERERQKALYKFNIVHTAKDANFDRIALLAKLVFNAKICLISLIDADEQWFKSEFGLGRESSPREESVCGHTILQDSHEPLVILDTTQDWRFEENPFVVKHPYTRFYAGAPLRTAEGYNIGSLCIIDSEPRSEFGPRQRHTLKEFAAIVMRELELWRDKIQLRIRDRIQSSMEQFTRECLEIDTQAQHGDPRLLLSSASMEKIYDRAAQLVKRTLDVEGAVLIDVSSLEEYDTQNNDGPMSVLLYHSDPKQGPQSKPLTAASYIQMTQFFKEFPDGKISDVVLPACIRGLMPGNIHYALTVPIFNIDKSPFALLCAYNTSTKSKPYLEGHEMSYLRAIGVIILSAVLKRRMILADKAKSLFISNISHELRTPLHGILAAAELLSNTDLSPNQAAFLNTVQACGTSLVETVNHVLDFTKLSGSMKGGGSENNIRLARVDMAQLVEEATEGCWIGHRARHSSEIGSVYSPPRPEDAGPHAMQVKAHVETVVDIEHRPKGWTVLCERGGIRRCLMNLLGNSLKFTTDGYVHVTLRQLHSSPNTPDDKIKLELGVLDSGKGISEEFLKNQLFQPFSQENPLQPGTGLGLAIVNSIVRSESVGGKIDVWSAEHFGTEIRIIFEAQLAAQEHTDVDDLGDWKVDGFTEPPAVTLLGFTKASGDKLLRQVVTSYLREWWKFECSASEVPLGDILILNEDVEHVKTLVEQENCRRPLIFLSSARGDPHVMNAIDAYERAGGFCRMVFKPVGPTALRQVMKVCVRVLQVGLPVQAPPGRNSMFVSREAVNLAGGRYLPRDVIDQPHRRRSDGAEKYPPTLARPGMPERSRTYNRTPASGLPQPGENRPTDEQTASSSSISTVPVGTGGLLLKSSIGSRECGNQIQVLVVEDNTILRELLVKWLRSRGYTVSEAADGQTGVDAFKSDPFDVVLLDMSMPVLDGVGAARAIRRIEQEADIHRIHHTEPDKPRRPSHLIALTGMSSREDKRRAFEAGVDGYLVKPVSFKTLQSMFRELGIT